MNTHAHQDRTHITTLRGDHTDISDYVKWIDELNGLTPAQIAELTERGYAVVQRIYCQALEPYGAWLMTTGYIYQYAEGAPLPKHDTAERHDLIEMIDLQIYEEMQELSHHGQSMQA